MRAVVEDGVAIDGSFITMMDECLACRACESACPSGVPFGRMIEAARAMAEPYRPARARAVRRIGLGFVLRHRQVIKVMALGLALTQATRLDKLLPSRLTAGTPRVSLRGMREPVPTELGAGPEAALLTGCVMNVAFRPVHRATMRLLAQAGYRATTPAPGGCCGALAAHYGQPEAAQRMARQRIVEFGTADVIVVNSAGCSAHMKSYGELLADDPAWAERSAQFATRVRDLLEIELRPERRTLGRVIVHDACHHLHAQKIGPQLRDLLRAGGAECVEVADAGRCCGAAGLYSMTEPEMSGVLRLQKARAIDAAGAPIVAVANPGCAGQIEAGLREIGSTVRVIHPAELLAP